MSARKPFCHPRFLGHATEGIHTLSGHHRCYVVVRRPWLCTAGHPISSRVRSGTARHMLTAVALWPRMKQHATKMTLRRATSQANVDCAPSMEGFLCSLKVRRVYGTNCVTREQAAQDLFESIGVHYNRKRQYSVLNRAGPLQFGARCHAA